jgi:uncharacterized protein (TIGR02996 family)
VPENAALYAAILAHPTEDTPRLAYADWLDENGEPDRARFIRLQYELEKLPPVGPKTAKLKKEEEALLKKHEKQWAGEITALVRLARFRRGFIEQVWITAEQFLGSAGRLFELTPIRTVRFEEIGDRMPALVASPHFGRAEEVGFPSYIMHQLGHDGRFEVLVAAPALARIRRLDLGTSYLHRHHAEQLARCPYLGSVVHLRLSSNPIGPDGLTAIVHSDRLPALTSLDLSFGCHAGLAGLRALVESPLADRLEHLVAYYASLGDESIKVLAAAPKLKRLLTLDLSHNKITADGFSALIASPHLMGLQRLTLRKHTKTLTKDMRERLKKRFGKDVCVF